MFEASPANPLKIPEIEEVAPVIELSMLETVLPIPLKAEDIEFIGDVILDPKFEIEPDNGFKLCNGLKADCTFKKFMNLYYIIRK